jgi:DNA modification methylase
MLEFVRTAQSDICYLVNDQGESLEIPRDILVKLKGRVPGITEMAMLWHDIQNQPLGTNITPSVVSPPSTAFKHPAKFSTGFIDIFRGLLQQHLYTPWKYPEPLVLDPFAGVGTIHQLRPEFTTYGYEIEPEWAAASEFTICGDSTNLPAAWNNTFAAVVTSPTYGNRMADHHEPGTCSECGGARYVMNEDGAGAYRCPKCDGAGVENSKRNTYRHTLGRQLSDNNTGQFQSTQRNYYTLHEAVYKQCWRVIEPNGLMIVNVSNHIRLGKEVDVCSMHKKILSDIGFKLITREEVATPRYGFGQNGQLRVDHEYIYVYRKVL